MRDHPPADVLGSLPRSRPVRRSDKRPPLIQPSQPQGPPATRGGPRPGAGFPGFELVAVAVRAAAEIAEIALSSGARALRRTVSNLPRP